MSYQPFYSLGFQKLKYSEFTCSLKKHYGIRSNAFIFRYSLYEIAFSQNLFLNILKQLLITVSISLSALISCCLRVKKIDNPQKRSCIFLLEDRSPSNMDIKNSFISCSNLETTVFEVRRYGITIIRINHPLRIRLARIKSRYINYKEDFFPIVGSGVLASLLSFRLTILTLFFDEILSSYNNELFVTNDHYDLSSYIVSCAREDCYVLQHGNITNEYFPMHALHFLIWGDIEKEIVQKIEPKIIIHHFGSPKHDQIFNMHSSSVAKDLESDPLKIYYFSCAHSNLYGHEIHRECEEWLIRNMSSSRENFSVVYVPHIRERLTRNKRNFLRSLGFIISKERKFKILVNNIDVIVSTFSTVVFEATLHNIPSIQYTSFGKATVIRGASRYASGLENFNFREVYMSYHSASSQNERLDFIKNRFYQLGIPIYKKIESLSSQHV